MNYVIIIACIFMFSSLYVYANSSLQTRFNIRITRVEVLIIVAVGFFVFILGGKILTLGQSSSLIEMELIAPSHMTPSGTEAIGRVLASPDARSSLDNCIITHTCPTGVDNLNSEIIVTAHDFIFSSANNEAAAEWLRKNSISLDSLTSWRGRYLHHYNTILYPAREVLDGNFEFLLSSQYGLASMMPVFFAKNQPFVVYPLAGLIILLLFCILVLFKHRQSKVDTAIWTVIFSLIAFTSNVGALRLSPGFSFFRYLPVLILIYLANKQLDNPKTKYIALASVAALFNSLQFNLLVLLIIVTVFFIISIGKKIKAKLFALPLILALIIGLQFLCYVIGKQGFTPELFGSVGEGEQSLLYTILILLFPITALFLKFVEPDNNEVSFNNSEILAYVSYGALATYAIAFAHSPQHYSGFIQMASISIFLIVKNNNKIIAQLILLSLFFLIPSYIFHYLQPRNNFAITQSSFYNYSEKLGNRMYFRTPTNISIIADEYHSLIARHALDKKVFFLSKDKLFIENYFDKNLEPKTYDVFANFFKFSADDTLTIILNEHVNFVVLDSDIQRANIKNFITMKKAYLQPEEFRHHINILSNFDSFAELIKPNLLECSSRYCIYRITNNAPDRLSAL